jgi:hypothetical protein
VLSNCAYVLPNSVKRSFLAFQEPFNLNADVGLHTGRDVGVFLPRISPETPE